MKRIIQLSIVFFVLLSLNLKGYAWNRRGHLMVAGIAYRQLQQSDPARLNKIIDILRSHPDIQKWKNEYDGASESFKSQISPAAYAFMRAAAWPDDVRSPANNPEHHPHWHYVNYPLSLPSTIDFTKAAPADNIFVAMKMAIDELGNSSTANVEKAKKLSWLFHLVGDIHQPLHTVALTNTMFPKGDQGGNALCIRPGNGGAIALHSYWDGLLGSSKNILTDTQNAWRDGAFFAQQNNDITPSQFNVPPNAVDWAKESANFALTNAYKFNSIPIELRQKIKIVGNNGKTREVCPDVDDWDSVVSDYNKDNQTLASRRVLMAGYRLANALSKITLK